MVDLKNAQLSPEHQKLLEEMKLHHSVVEQAEAAVQRRRQPKPKFRGRRSPTVSVQFPGVDAAPYALPEYEVRAVKRAMRWLHRNPGRTPPGHIREKLEVVGLA